MRLPSAAVVREAMMTPLKTAAAPTHLPKCVAINTLPPEPGIILVKINHAEFKRYRSFSFVNSRPKIIHVRADSFEQSG